MGGPGGSLLSNDTDGGNGGPGVVSTFSGSAVTLCEGGGGCAFLGTPGSGGTTGGDGAQHQVDAAGGSAVANSGSGGGGGPTSSGSDAGGDGGSGRITIRVRKAA